MRKIIGYKDFGENIDITDPCYDRDVWCRTNDLKIRAGNYECVVYLNEHSRVNTIGIYLNGITPKKEEFSEIDEIGVDAGLAGFFNNKPDYDDDAWGEFCQKIKDGNAWIFDEGFFSSSGYGDGCYGVYAYKDNGEITALEIRFIE